MKIKVLLSAVGFICGLGCGWIIWGDGLRFGPTCPDGARPDKNGCCNGEVYTDMADVGWACCPDAGDCYPPIRWGAR